MSIPTGRASQGRSGKESPAVLETQETRIRPQGGEDALKEGMAAHSSLLAWRIPWTEEPGRLQPITAKSRTRMNQLGTHTQAGNPCTGATQVEGCLLLPL